MMTTNTATATRIAAGKDRTRYDGLAMTLHWLTTALVLIQFGLAELWGFFPKPDRHLMIAAHMSFGILLALVLVARVAWRLTPGHPVREAVTGWMGTASKAVHYLLYVLLGTEAVLGFLWRWSGNEDMSFFGLLIPPPFAPFDKPTHNLIATAHNVLAWTIIVVAIGHAGAALFHQFVLRDGLLWRMLPGRGAAQAERRTPSPEQAAGMRR